MGYRKWKRRSPGHSIQGPDISLVANFVKPQAQSRNLHI